MNKLAKLAAAALLAAGLAGCSSASDTQKRCHGSKQYDSDILIHIQFVLNPRKVTYLIQK